jgi:hypothetical protein
MHNLWGEEIQAQQKKRHPQPKKQPSPKCIIVNLTAQDCLLFGHSFTLAGMSNEKVCSTCGIHAYCPGCTPIAPMSAIPFFCTNHTPEERIQA